MLQGESEINALEGLNPSAEVAYDSILTRFSKAIKMDHPMFLHTAKNFL